MKTKLIFIMIVLSVGLLSYSQKKDNLKLIRETTKSAFPYSYKNENWDDKFVPSLNMLGYDLVDMKIDTVKIHPIVRDVISSKYYRQLNKEQWHIWGNSKYPTGSSSYDLLKNSTKNCN
jgi:hypothetical protein